MSITKNENLSELFNKFFEIPVARTDLSLASKKTQKAKLLTAEFRW